MKMLLVVAVAAVVAAPAAQAGCWATVKLSSMPDGGRVWNVRVTPLQHGRTALPNAKPRIEIRLAGGAWRVFAARPTPRSGVFRAAVVFPAAGTWQLRIWDGFEPSCARYHTYPAVVVR